MSIRIAALAGLLMMTAWTSESSANFTYIATHPYASQQSSTLGKYLFVLKEYQSSIYSGYGDWNQNTGPIRMCRLTPPSTSFNCEFVLHNEAVEGLRVYNNDLYAVGIDPGGGGWGNYAVRENGSWSESGFFTVNGAYPPHNFDIAYYSGALWMIGQQWDGNNQYATAWKSTNGGSSWSIGKSSISAGPSNYHFGVIYNNKMYIQPATGSGGNPNGGNPVSSHLYSLILNGSSWSNGPNLLPFGSGRKANVFDGAIVMIQNGYLTAFDGSTTTYASQVAVTDYTIEGEYLYILRSTDKKIYRTKTANSSGYMLVDQAPAPSNAVSIEVLNNTVYVGTKNSQIHKSDVDLSSIASPTLAPITTLLLLDD